MKGIYTKDKHGQNYNLIFTRNQIRCPINTKVAEKWQNNTLIKSAVV